MASRRSYRAKGIVLDRTVLGEHDLILTLLLESGEQLRAVAKGVRRGRSRISARCDFFCESDFLIYQGRKLDVVSDATSVDAHHGLSASPEKISAAAAVCELAGRTSFEGSPDAFLHPILSRALSVLEQAADQPHLDLIVAAYAFKVLAHSGWRPELGECVSCGDPHPAYFSVALGGVLCESCAREVEGAEAVSPSEISWIRALIASTFDQLLDAGVDPETAMLVLSLSHLWAATHLDARLRAFEFMLSM